jgi:chromatin assembly factor 1 subunit B
MKVETPQILWNNEAEKGKNAPLLSIDMLQSGIADPTSSTATNTQVLVTAGNATSINLWKVIFGHEENKNTESGIFCRQTTPLNKIDYMISLTRHDVAVNSVAFSPDGLHLATAGDSGNIVIFSVPIHKRGNKNGRHFWSTLTKENQLTVRIISTHCEGVVDLSWSSDSKRFAVGTIDSCLIIYEDKHFDMNACNPETHQKESEWQQVFRNAEHGSFVQGVSYDPLGVYIASMGNDRVVRVFPRKTPPKSKKKVLRPANDGSTNMVTPPQDHQRMVQQLLMDSKVEIGKIKRIKQRLITTMEEDDAVATENVDNCDQGEQHQQVAQQRQIKQKLFVDESNCESFFRRLSWTADGAFLVTPAALWHANGHAEQDNASSDDEHSSSSPTFSTYLFARHKFEEPYRVLAGLDKPSVVVRPNPVLFELPAAAIDGAKENQSPSDSDGNNGDRTPCKSGLPYRSIFAVLTLDSVLIYDTYHVHPLSVMQGLHYAGLTDCCWSQDGMNLLVCSSDGYITIVNFSEGELGTRYSPPKNAAVESSPSNTFEPETLPLPPPADAVSLPPCESGPANVLMAPPPKRAKKMRITPTLVSTVPSGSPMLCNAVIDTASNYVANVTTKRGISDTETETVGAAVTKLTLDAAGAATVVGDGNESNSPTVSLVSNGSGEKPKKKKKRVQPMLISGSI